MQHKGTWREVPSSISIQDHTSKTVDVQKQFDTVAVLIEDSLDDGGLRFREGGSSVEGIATDEVA